jgi:hypothetical protein
MSYDKASGTRLNWAGRGWYACILHDGIYDNDRIGGGDRQQRPVTWGTGYGTPCWYETELAYVIGKGWGK